MSLLFAMMPIYIMGNLHCIGMCGPIAMWIGTSPFRWFYLFGRLISFTIAGTIAGSVGEVIGALLSFYHLSGAFSFLLGMGMLIGGILIGWDYAFPFSGWFFKKISKVQDTLGKWLLINEPWPLFLLGFMTIALPCGQTLLVYSACALSGNAFVGTLNGFVFGLMTTPALILSMQARTFIAKARIWYAPVVSFSACLVGIIAILRGLAEWGMIRHIGIHPVIIF